ncbi:MAG TPA: hypothetical protein VMV18_01455 [bacterium]|nr:hypothetical protein [bacterium]
MRRVQNRLALALPVLSLALGACAQGDSARDQEPRIIKIQIEGCKEQSPAPTPQLASAPTPPTAVAGSAGSIATSAASVATPTVALAGAPSPGGADLQYFQKLGEVKGMLDGKHLSRLDLPVVDAALTRADVEAASGHYDEAMRQLGVAENATRVHKMDMGTLNTKLERLSKAVEKLRTTSPGDYGELNRQLQEANTELLVGRYPRARDILWRVDSRLDEIAMRGMPKR